MFSRYADAFHDAFYSGGILMGAMVFIPLGIYLVISDAIKEKREEKKRKEDKENEV